MNYFSCMYLAYNCLWTCTHITCSQVPPLQVTHNSPDLCPRATSVCVPLPHQLMSLCRNLSRACIGMFESLLLFPYYADDLWTIVHRPDMGHCLCHRNRLTIVEFHLSSFLTPKKNEKIVECSSFLSYSLKYRREHLYHLIYLLLWTI